MICDNKGRPPRRGPADETITAAESYRTRVEFRWPVATPNENDFCLCCGLLPIDWNRRVVIYGLWAAA
jgi:hypothetical protein